VVHDVQSGEYRIVLLAADAKKLANITKQHGGETLLVISGGRIIMRLQFRVPVTDGVIRMPSRLDTADVLKSFTNEIRDYHK
jgi:hypothetical protein